MFSGLNPQVFGIKTVTEWENTKKNTTALVQLYQCGGIFVSAQWNVSTSAVVPDGG